MLRELCPALANKTYFNYGLGLLETNETLSYTGLANPSQDVDQASIPTAIPTIHNELAH